jgi:hypothetical protein
LFLEELIITRQYREALLEILHKGQVEQALLQVCHCARLNFSKLVFVCHYKQRGNLFNTYQLGKLNIETMHPHPFDPLSPPEISLVKAFPKTPKLFANVPRLPKLSKASIPMIKSSSG